MCLLYLNLVFGPVFYQNKIFDYSNNILSNVLLVRGGLCYRFKLILAQSFYRLKNVESLTRFL